MKDKFQKWMEQLLPIEQKAVKVSTICSAVFFTVLVGTIITVNVLASSKQDLGSKEDNTNYVNSFPLNQDELKDTILPKTQDAGQEYLNETLFIGDSNTQALYEYGLLPLNQVSAKVGAGVSSASSEAICYFKDDEKGYTMIQTIAKVKPRRVIFSFGTNDVSNKTTSEFIEEYRAVLQQAKTEYPYADILVNAVYPIAKKNNYPDISMGTIDAYNQALADLCKEEGYKFLNTTEILKDATGYLNPQYANADGIHLKVDALKQVLTYVREHAYETEDKRPDTDNIPQRRKVATISSESAESSDVTASYHVEIVEGKSYGTLSGEDFSDATSKQFKVSNSQNTFTITAIPNEGYEFVKWSDGVETASRTDKNIKNNISVTAIFRAKASISISASKTQANSSGEDIQFQAKLSGNGQTKDISWQLNGKTLSNVSGDSVKLNVKPGDKVTATIGNSVSNAIIIELKVQLSISPTSASAKVGQTITYTASGDGIDFSEVIWKVNNKQYKKGKTFSFTPDQAQSFTITATYQDVTVTARLTVTEVAPPPPSSSNPTPAPPPSSSSEVVPPPSSESSSSEAPPSSSSSEEVTPPPPSSSDSTSTPDSSNSESTSSSEVVPPEHPEPPVTEVPPVVEE